MYAAPLALALAVHAAPSARPHAAVRVPLSPAPSLSRRQLAASGLLVPAALALGAGVSPASAAADVAAETASLPVYFGCGCFWHVQHEFVDCERQVLGRKDAELTSRCGYAGGLKTGDGGKVCYHNLRRDSDYGKLGHAEAVAMRIPPSKLPDFAKLYFSLFVPYKFPGMTVLERNDPQDAGPEYRSLLGLPGGVKSPLFPAIEAAAQGKWKLVEGKGNEPDTLLKRTIYVMDSDEFPFYPAEVYHQFHNDFQSPPYGKAYNSISDLLVKNGDIKTTGCPELGF